MAALTVDDILKESEVGTLIPLIVEVNDKIVPIIFVKDYLEALKDIGDNVLVALKSSIISNKKLDLLLIMIRFDEREENTYDLWLNYGFNWHFDFLNGLINLEKILIDFRDEDNNRIKTIEVCNTIKKDLEKYKESCEDSILIKEGKEENIIKVVKRKKYESWNNEDALDLIDEVLDDYSSIQDMWENL